MVCNTLARLDFILVPLPAARTAAKIGGASWRWSMTFKTPSAGSGRLRAGAAGFEPAIPGPKPGALPLGHAPVSSHARAAAIIPEALATIRAAKPCDGSASCRPPSERWRSCRPAAPRARRRRSRLLRMSLPRRCPGPRSSPSRCLRHRPGSGPRSRGARGRGPRPGSRAVSLWGRWASPWARPRKGISMKMSSCGSGLEGGLVTQHRPQDVNPATGQRDQGLGVLLALPSLAVVEGSGVRRAAQAGKSRLVEDPLEDLVAPAHPAVVADPLSGVLGGRHEAGVGSELVGALKGREVSHAHQELGTEDRTHAWQASEYPGLGTGEKTLPELPIEVVDALLEGESLFGEFGADRGGDILGREGDALGLGRGDGLPGDVLGPLDAAVLEEGGEAPVAHTADGAWGLVVAHQDEGALGAQVQRPLQSREEGKEDVPQTVDGPGPVGDEIPPTGEQELQFGESVLAGNYLREVGPYPGLLGDDVGVTGIGLGLPGVGVASPIHGQSGEVEDPLLSLPQERQKQRRAAPGLVDGPDSFLRQGEDLVDEPREVGLVVSDAAGEDPLPRSVEHVSPVELFAGVDPGPHLVHESLRPSVASDSSPVEDPADGSLCSESWTSPISISRRSLRRSRGAIPFKPSVGGAHEAILGPLGRRPDTVPERQTQR